MCTLDGEEAAAAEAAFRTRDEGNSCVVAQENQAMLDRLKGEFEASISAVISAVGQAAESLLANAEQLELRQSSREIG